MRTHHITLTSWEVLMNLLTPANALAVEVMLYTGLRVGDVLALPSTVLGSGRSVKSPARFTVKESKTGKSRSVYLPAKLRLALLAQCGDIYVFPGARDPCKHRTRQAVWCDIKRAAKAMRIPLNVGAHSARKSYACDLYEHGKSLDSIQKKLNHDNIETTILYLLDEFDKTRIPSR